MRQLAKPQEVLRRKVREGRTNMHGKVPNAIETTGEVTEEYKLLLRDLRQAARTLLDVRAKMPFALFMFRYVMQQEALRITDGNRCHAAKLLGLHRNTFTRNLLPSERLCSERFKHRPEPRSARVMMQQVEFPMDQVGTSHFGKEDSL